jgi:hypothetical protein
MKKYNEPTKKEKVIIFEANDKSEFTGIKCGIDARITWLIEPSQFKKWYSIF